MISAWHRRPRGHCGDRYSRGGASPEGRRGPARLPARQSAERLASTRRRRSRRSAVHVGVQQSGRVRPARQSATAPSDLTPELATEWAWNDAETKTDLQAAPGREVARRQAVHQRRREVHLGHDHREAEVRLAQEPAPGMVFQSAGGHHQRRLRGELSTRPAAAVVPRAACRAPSRPSIPAMSTAREMRQKPIGTGPFKVVEFRPNDRIKLTRNTDYWRPGRPYLDGIEWKIVTNRSTRILAFVAGEFDLTFTQDVTVPLLRDIEGPGAQRILRAEPVRQPGPVAGQPRSGAVRQREDPRAP